MRKLLFGLFFLSLSTFAGAQTPVKVVLKKAGPGKISVAQGRLRAVVDLTEETAGCVYVSGAAKRALDRRGCTASPATYRLVDAVRKDGSTFLVVMSEASGNCNVCGQCGASDNFALIWLRLDARFRVADRKSVPIEYCLTNTSLVEPVMTEDDYMANRGPQLPFADDVLRVAFEKSDYTEKDERIYLYTTLEYNRKTPEKGFVIKTERRDRSATEE